MMKKMMVFLPQAWDESFSASVDGLQVDFLPALLRSSFTYNGNHQTMEHKILAKEKIG